jgi:hypothetical protein
MYRNIYVCVYIYTYIHKIIYIYTYVYSKKTSTLKRDLSCNLGTNRIDPATACPVSRSELRSAQVSKETFESVKRDLL